MKRVLCALMLVVTIMTMGGTTAYAWPTAEEHYQDIEKVLFGYELSSFQRKGAIHLLEIASALALDQFQAPGDPRTGNISGTSKLYFLRASGVNGLPEQIDEINLVAPSNTHRSYTHRGWDFVYPDDRASWEKRKNIMLATSEHIFDFDVLAGTWLGTMLGRKYNKKCDSFCALVYYTHVLGDHLCRKSYKIDEIIIPLGVAHPSDTNRDVYYELGYHISVLFESQNHSHRYKWLFQDMSALAEEARRLAATTGGVNTDEEFAQYHKNAERLLETLSSYVPKLLKEEPFFQKVFPAK